MIGLAWSLPNAVSDQATRVKGILNIKLTVLEERQIQPYQNVLIERERFVFCGLCCCTTSLVSFLFPLFFLSPSLLRTKNNTFLSWFVATRKSQMCLKLILIFLGASHHQFRSRRHDCTFIPVGQAHPHLSGDLPGIGQ